MAETNEVQIKTQNYRLDYIDILKGIGIVLVIWGHMIPRGVLWNLIYGCHMPLFIFCSGLFEKRQLRWDRLVKLLLKYLGLSALGVGIHFLVYEFGNIYYIKQSVYNVMVGGISPGHGIYPVEALWFIPCLLLMILLYHAVCLLPRKGWQQVGAIAVEAMGVIISKFRNQIPMVFSLDVCLIMLPFFYLGSLIKEKLRMAAGIRSGKLLIFLVPAAVLYFVATQWKGEVNIYRGLSGKSLIVFYIGALLGISLLLTVSILISRHGKVISKVVQEVGKHTLVMMGVHQIVILLLREEIEGWGILLLPVLLISYGVSACFRKIHEVVAKKRRNRND